MNLRLTDGRLVSVEHTIFGQVRCVDVHEDLETACELLDVSPSEVRYGLVHPSPACVDPLNDTLNEIFARFDSEAESEAR